MTMESVTTPTPAVAVPRVVPAVQLLFASALRAKERTEQSERRSLSAEAPEFSPLAAQRKGEAMVPRARPIGPVLDALTAQCTTSDQLVSPTVSTGTLTAPPALETAITTASTAEPTCVTATRQADRERVAARDRAERERAAREKRDAHKQLVWDHQEARLQQEAEQEQQRALTSPSALAALREHELCEAEMLSLHAFSKQLSPECTVDNQLNQMTVTSDPACVDVTHTSAEQPNRHTYEGGSTQRQQAVQVHTKLQDTTQTAHARAKLVQLQALIKSTPEKERIGMEERTVFPATERIQPSGKDPPTTPAHTLLRPSSSNRGTVTPSRALLTTVDCFRGRNGEGVGFGDMHRLGMYTPAVLTDTSNGSRTPLSVTYPGTDPQL